MPDQFNQTPTEAQGLAGYFNPEEQQGPQYVSPPDYVPDQNAYVPPPNYVPTPAMMQQNIAMQQASFPQNAYAPPPNYVPPTPAMMQQNIAMQQASFPQKDGKADAYAPPPNYVPPTTPAPIVPFEQYHPGPLAQYVSPPDYEGPSYDDATLSSRTVEQDAPGPGLGREPTTYGTGADAYRDVSAEPVSLANQLDAAGAGALRGAWTPQQAHEARQLLPPPHMLEQPPPRDKMDAGAPAGAPVAKEKPKDEEKKT